MTAPVDWLMWSYTWGQSGSPEAVSAAEPSAEKAAREPETAVSGTEPEGA